MSNVAVLSGPSEAALNGEQRVLTSGDDCFCDDGISPEVMDLICGVYEVETGQKGEMICLSSTSKLKSFEINMLWSHGFRDKTLGMFLDSMLVNGLMSVKIGM